MNLWGRVPTPVGEDPLPALMAALPSTEQPPERQRRTRPQSLTDRLRRVKLSATSPRRQNNAPSRTAITSRSVGAAARTFASRGDIAPRSLSRYRETDRRANCLGGYSFNTESAVIQLLLAALHHLAGAGHQHLT